MSFCNILDDHTYSVAFWRQVKPQRCSTRREETLWCDETWRLASSNERSRRGVNPAGVRQFGSIFGESQRLIYALPPVSGIGLIPGRTILARFGARPNGSPIRPLEWCLGVPEGEPNPIDKPKGPSKPNKSWCLGGASYILSKLINQAPYSPKIRVLDYLLSEHNYQHFLGNFFVNIKLSFNRGNPTSLLNSYLTNLCRLFVLFYHYLCDKKLNMEDE